jgi:hypothetical protein
MAKIMIFQQIMMYKRMIVKLIWLGKIYQIKSLKYLYQNFTKKKKNESDYDTSVESGDECTDDSSTC